MILWKNERILIILFYLFFPVYFYGLYEHLWYYYNFRYVDSAQSLARETNIDLSKYEVCDNIDLETILMEYESYYYVKFSKYPKITKKLGPQSGKWNNLSKIKPLRLACINKEMDQLVRFWLDWYVLMTFWNIDLSGLKLYVKAVSYTP